MRLAFAAIYSSEVDGLKQLIAETSCHKLEKLLKPISFKLQNTTITIPPAGYLTSDTGQNIDCLIGISEIPDQSNQYRLGTIFLRNFYTAFDYDKDLIMLGVHKNIPLNDRPSMERGFNSNAALIKHENNTSQNQSKSNPNASVSEDPNLSFTTIRKEM